MEHVIGTRNQTCGKHGRRLLAEICGMSASCGQLLAVTCCVMKATAMA